MEVQFLGVHCIEARGLRLPSFLIDCILALDAGGLTSSLSLSEQQKLKAILLTHHHCDHTRDLVTLGVNGSLFQSPVEVYALRHSLDIIKSCFLDEGMEHRVLPGQLKLKPLLQLKSIKPLQRQIIASYEVLPVPVNHVVPAVGYQVTSKDGKSLFYTGDTGPGLSSCWERISPQLLIIEVTGLNRDQTFWKSVGHLSAQLLKDELIQFRRIKGYLPHIVVVHIVPQYQEEVEQEVEDVSQELGADIDIGYEGMKITL